MDVRGNYPQLASTSWDLRDCRELNYESKEIIFEKQFKKLSLGGT